MKTFKKIDPAQCGIIFGGEDPEQQEALAVANEAGFAFVATATAVNPKTGQPTRVHAGNADKATGYLVESGSDTGISQVVVFEAALAAAGDLEVILNPDHHKPGDAGYEVGPEDYWEGSALGQLMIGLGIKPTHQQLLIAAADHCVVDAYQGNCPGIDPQDVLDLRIKNKVSFYASKPALAHKADAMKIEAAILAATEVLEGADTFLGARDLRQCGEEIDELPEAALRGGYAYVAEIPELDRQRKPTGNRKVTMGGHTSPEMVEAFMAWGENQPRKVAVYGNPTRGFAGVILKPEE